MATKPPSDASKTPACCELCKTSTLLETGQDLNVLSLYVTVHSRKSWESLHTSSRQILSKHRNRQESSGLSRCLFLDGSTKRLIRAQPDILEETWSGLRWIVKVLWLHVMAWAMCSADNCKEHTVTVEYARMVPAAWQSSAAPWA